MRPLVQHVPRLTMNGEPDERALLMSLADDMDTVKQLMAGATAAERTQLCARYPGFSRFGKLLERVTTGMASGRIPVPK